MNETWSMQYQHVFHLMKSMPKWQAKTDADFRTWLSMGILTGTQIAVLQGIDEETPRRWRKNGLKTGENPDGTPVMVYLEAINGEGIRGKPVMHTKTALKKFLQETGIKPTADLAWVLSYDGQTATAPEKPQQSQKTATESRPLADPSDRIRMMELQLRRVELEKKQIELELEKAKLEWELKQLEGK